MPPEPPSPDGYGDPHYGPQGDPGVPGYPQHGYVPQVYYDYPGHVGPDGQWAQPGRQRSDRGQIMRAVLILAAVAGVVTVAVGMLLMAGAPEEYGLSDARTPLKLQAQPTAGGLPPTVGPGGDGVLAQAAPTASAPLAPLPPAPAMQPSTPKRLIIKKLGVNAPISSVGTDRKGAIQTPPINNHNLVGWYRLGPTAGQAGPAVMLGHKDTNTRTAVFSRLPELRYGDTIEVLRMDGTVAIFTVGGVEQADKQTFPTNRVYGNAEAAELRLITCGGQYNRTTGHYTDNVIVYATMTGSRRSGAATTQR
ncbi:class F sortase [Sphaerisporangium sp. TRM90804]|uniref:class F sortase n=1 Tax=Sphaerisporangium sp. TRM90804 TaxID=3031113 RepID=UPI00244ADC0A|nr:class F sortase [Sphaerisporangium sp. TRM90804]MDH2427067.1 class F sortase [Sphaerisporangium sp. TRM90804]